MVSGIYRAGHSARHGLRCLPPLYREASAIEERLETGHRRDIYLLANGFGTVIASFRTRRDGTRVFMVRSRIVSYRRRIRRATFHRG
ncbi:hypothetical protein D3C74_329780 [compost metagenome]